MMETIRAQPHRPAEGPVILMLAILALTPIGQVRAAEPGRVLPLAERERIEAALPRQATVRPSKPRRLLIFDLNVGYGGHASIAHANHAFTRMGQVTGAFEKVISRDPAVFERGSLRQFDAVFLNNTVGNLFTDPALRQSLVEFVYAGGGLLGVHGASVAFTRWPGAFEDWPEFGIMLGARGANHRDSNERVFIKLDDPDHPLTRVFGGRGFEYRDEFFRVNDPYSRSRLRVLLSIDIEQTDLNQGQARGNCERADNDYALAWIRSYGRGRVFYCTIAHNPYVFWDPRMLEFYLDALQFVLGDLPAPTTPSARLTPALRAQERLGGHLEIAPDVTGRLTLFEAIDQAAALGVLEVGARSSQILSREIPVPLDGDLAAEARRELRLKLDAAGVRVQSYRLDSPLASELAARRAFRAARRLGAETIVASAPPELIPLLDRLSAADEIRLALRPDRSKDGAKGWQPEKSLEACASRGEQIGVCGYLDAWTQAGLEPRAAVRTLGARLFVLELGDAAGGAEGAKRFEPEAECMREISRLGLKPMVISLNAGESSMSDLRSRIAALNRMSEEAVKE